MTQTESLMALTNIITMLNKEKAFKLRATHNLRPRFPERILFV